MSNPYYDDPRMMGGGLKMDRRPDHGVCVFSHGVGNINARAGSHEINDLKKAFADQVMNTLHHSMNIVVVPSGSGFSIEMWMPENIQMPRLRMMEPEFRPVPMPNSLKGIMSRGELKEQKSKPKKIFFYDQLKKEVTDWIKN